MIYVSCVCSSPVLVDSNVLCMDICGDYAVEHEIAFILKK